MTFEFSLLGSPEVRLGQAALRFPTRKAMALLIFLVCEPGLHTRERLADLLWPEAQSMGGRSSLRSALLAIRSMLEPAGAMALLEVRRDDLGFVSLAGVRVDVLEVQAAAAQVRAAGQVLTGDWLAPFETMVAGIRGDFLQGLTLPDAPEFEAWLGRRRNASRHDVDMVLSGLTRWYATTGQQALALATARRRVQLDLLNESAHRALIELCVEAGDHGAALEAFRACQALLERELGIAPAPETVAVVRRAVAGGQVISSPLPSRVPFVGREREWAQLQGAWDGGLVVFVSGEPGAGKSRLMQEFLRSRGGFVALENRPGDVSVPYSSVARHLRVLLAAANLTLEPWVRSELSRILPEFGENPPPIQSEHGKLVFFQAITAAFTAFVVAASSTTTFLYDDAQFTDHSSAEVSAFVFDGLLAEHAARVRLLFAYREHELPEATAERVAKMIAAGQGVLLQLRPLDAAALTHWLTAAAGTTFDLRDRDGLADLLQRLTGGNPLFVLETLKALDETHAGESLDARALEALHARGALPRSTKVSQVITQRFERLSKAARDLARVVAVMGQEATAERAALVLEATPTDLARASEELDAAGFVRQHRFTHDLVFETTLQGISVPARTLLHARVLKALEGTGASAAVLAHHAVQAGAPLAVFRHNLEAGLEATHVYAMDEAIAYFRAALPVAKTHRGIAVAELQRLYVHLAGAYKYVNRYAEARVIAKEMLALARRLNDVPMEGAAINLIMVIALADGLELEEAGVLGERALRLAEEHRDTEWLASTELTLARLDEFVGRWPRALERLDHAIRLGREHGLLEVVPTGLVTRAITMFTLGRWRECRASAAEAVPLARALDLKLLEADAVMSGGFGAICMGDLNAGLTLVRRGHAINLQVRADWMALVSGYVISLGLLDLGDLGEALEYAVQSAAIADGLQRRWFLDVECLCSLALAQLAVGGLEAASRALDEATEINDMLMTRTVRARYSLPSLASLRCHIAVRRGDWALAAAHALEAAQAREAAGNHAGWHVALPRWLETEALLRAGHAETALESLEHFEAALAESPRLRVCALRSRATAEDFAGRLDVAQATLEAALELAQRLGLGRDIFEIEAERASLLDRQGEPEAARLIWARANAARETLAASIPDEATRQRFLEFTAVHLPTAAASTVENRSRLNGSPAA